MKYYRVKDFYVTSVPKAGTKSIEATLGPQAEVQAAEAFGNRVITFFRHPIDRLISAYRYFNNTVPWPRDTAYYRSQHRNDVPYERFVDDVLAGAKNRHWDSQTEQLMHGQRFVPTELYPFEHINQVWPLVVGCELKHVNASNKVTVDNMYRIGELMSFYGQDFDNWLESHNTLTRWQRDS